MSDDEELIYIKKQKTIHYGSLEEQERQRQASAPLVPPGEEVAEDVTTAPDEQAAPAVVGNIHVSDGMCRMFFLLIIAYIYKS